MARNKKPDIDKRIKVAESSADSARTLARRLNDLEVIHANHELRQRRKEMDHGIERDAAAPGTGIGKRMLRIYRQSEYERGAKRLQAEVDSAYTVRTKPHEDRVKALKKVKSERATQAYARSKKREY